eukprot:ANDGO_03212.mRNA.1 E3 ubiquitin-protein ligase dbl4
MDDLDFEEAGETYDYEYEYNDDEDSMTRDEGFYGGDMIHSPHVPAPVFKVVSPDDLAKSQSVFIKQISEILNCSLSAAGSLARYFHWDRQKLLENYYSDEERTLQKAGVDTRNVGYKKGKFGAPLMCNICFDQKDGSEMCAVSCNHFFCACCYRGYLESKLNEGPSVILTTCPFPKCTCVVSEDCFRDLMAADCVTRYETFLTRSFVDDNPNVRWCPAPNCGNAVSAENAKWNTVCECSCQKRFCFGCGADPHNPAPCKVVKDWMSREVKESATSEWLVKNTRDCPKCSVRIHKDGGCNHVTCSKCRYEFCWICGDDWTRHGSSTGGYYSCNRFNETSTAPGRPGGSATSAAAKLRDGLEKYVHHLNRFQNHEQASKYESKIRSRINKLKEQRSGSSMDTLEDIDYLTVALDAAMRARSVLKWTYVAAFYMSLGPHKEVFSHSQEQLEGAVEHLTSLLEKDLTTINRTEVMFLTTLITQWIDRVEHFDYDEAGGVDAVFDLSMLGGGFLRTAASTKR